MLNGRLTSSLLLITSLIQIIKKKHLKITTTTNGNPYQRKQPLKESTNYASSDARIVEIDKGVKAHTREKKPGGRRAAAPPPRYKSEKASVQTEILQANGEKEVRAYRRAYRSGGTRDCVGARALPRR